MSDMEKKTYSFHSVIVSTNRVVAIKCFLNEVCTIRKLVILLCVIYIYLK